MKKIPYRIPLQIPTYEDFFHPIDNLPPEKRRINVEIDDFIRNIFMLLPIHRRVQIILLLTLSESSKDIHKENILRNALSKYYYHLTIVKRKERNKRIRRLIYYLITSSFLLLLWYYLTTLQIGEFLSTTLNTAGTVVLWQAMSVVFIDSKDFTEERKMFEILQDTEIEFLYEE